MAMNNMRLATVKPANSLPDHGVENPMAGRNTTEEGR
jgi:hypothetical protein